MADQPVPLRIDAATLKRLDRIAEALSERAAGIPVPRAHAIRVCLERGAELVERELGLTTTKRKR